MVQIIFYFLFGNVQVSFAFLLSSFFKQARTATIVSYLWVFGSALVSQQLLQSIIRRERWFTPVIQLVPTFGAFRCAARRLLCSLQRMDLMKKKTSNCRPPTFSQHTLTHRPAVVLLARISAPRELRRAPSRHFTCLLSVAAHRRCLRAGRLRAVSTRLQRQTERPRCRGLWELGEYSFFSVLNNLPGMQISDVNSRGNGMLIVWIIFLIEWPLFLVLAWYLEQVLDSGTGIRKHWLFPFMRTKSKPCAPPLHTHRYTPTVAPSWRCHRVSCTLQMRTARRISSLDLRPFTPPSPLTFPPLTSLGPPSDPPAGL